MGVGLADARLLIEKFKIELKSEELLKYVNSVRHKSKELGASLTKKKRSSGISIDFSWHHYDKKKRKHALVKVQNGGGIRSMKVARSYKLEQLFCDMKNIYFPDGKSKKCGLLCLNSVSLCKADMTEISNRDIDINQHVSENFLKTCRFILKTKANISPF